MDINKEYLDNVKQDMVNLVAGTSNIVPEIFMSVTDMPKPTVTIQFHKQKSELRKQRRKDISQIWNNNPNDAIKLTKEYHEKELLVFLDRFPEFKEVIL